MHAKIAYIILGALGALTSATPVGSVNPAETTGSVAPAPLEGTVVATEVGPEARAAGPTVKLCTDADVIPGNYNDVVSAFGPSSGQTCTIYRDTNCRGDSRGGIKYPGISDLRALNFNDVLSSYACF
ncbi:MAG: hypothetical protein LQ339_002406 [Xanthoria mediterranea]|nr:MAG: hypothetical protein LQ339_002406 [Xanthoria mediterranea]